MKLTLENTTMVVIMGGVLMRVWEGQSESGVPVIALIARVAVPEGFDAGEFGKTLVETAVPAVDMTPFQKSLRE